MGPCWSLITVSQECFFPREEARMPIAVAYLPAERHWPPERIFESTH